MLASVAQDMAHGTCSIGVCQYCSIARHTDSHVPSVSLLSSLPFPIHPYTRVALCPGHTYRNLYATHTHTHVPSISHQF